MAHYLVYRWPGGEPPLPLETEPFVKWEWADASLAKALFDAEPARLAAQMAMLKEGYIGLLCIADSRWRAYAWMRRPQSRGPAHLPAKARRLDCYWITYCRTRTGFEGRGLFTASLRMLVAAALGENRNASIFIDADYRNDASQRAIVRAGFRPSGEMRTVSIGLPRVGKVVMGSWRDQ